ncbi:MAG: N-acetylmuramoyl-L-alanine amidase [Myxococcota bacterium]|jgi:N-acetyl-anhydromuramyl-L-alanine amidase AmpD|nr:N-acetylmuramoyl-L-alanine amidase [Myxococcota bacterium]
MHLDEFESEQFHEFEQTQAFEAKNPFACCAACRQRALGLAAEAPGYPSEEELEAKAASKPVMSPLARASKFGLNSRGGARRYPVYGLIVHTTGGGPARRARLNLKSKSKSCKVALDCALKVYAGGEGFPHYVIDYDGSIVCTCSEGHIAWHSGASKAAVAYIREHGAPAWWKKTWGAKQSPFALPPQSRSPNHQYLGVELLQTEAGGSYSDAQYRALAALIADVERRYGLKFDRPPNRALLGHEDVNPAPYQGGKIGGRSLDSLKAGWDPGASRGWFSWDKLWRALRGNTPAPAGIQGELDSEAPSTASPLRRKGAGYAAYTKQRLDDTLRQLRAAGRLSVTDQQIDLFQRISNVETGGGITALNTWDSAVVSVGFMQWTLSHGKLQTWIRAAAPAFRRHGIELEPDRTYAFKGGAVAAIRGAATARELRLQPWAERFYRASFEPEAIIAEVAIAQRMIANELDRVRLWYGAAAHQRFAGFYRQSAWLRAIFHEGYNNRPVAAKAAVKAAIARSAGVDATRFLEIFKEELVRAFTAIGDGQKGKNVIAKTQKLR